MNDNSGSYNSQANQGSFVQTTFNLQMQQSQDLNIDQGLKRLLVLLYQDLNKMQISLNQRDWGSYYEDETLNGQVYFPVPGTDSTSTNQPEPRQVFRTVVNFGPLLDGSMSPATKTVPHDIDIDNGYSFTRIYGTSTNSTQTSFIPLPYSSCTSVADNIELFIDDKNINITTNADQSDYINTYVVLEYIKQL